MKSADLDLRELLEFDAAKGGPIHFAGERVLLFDAVALGLLRRALIDTLGVAGARARLSRFGYAHGWRAAESMKHLPWQSEDDWRRAGGRLHTLQGRGSVEPLPPTTEPNAPFAETIWRDSYEAEQHLLHVGRSDEAVCWTLSGFASGYMSFANGREIFCLEETCVGKGDAVCRAVARETAAWGARIEPYLAFYRSNCTNEALRQVADQIKKSEQKLRARRNARAADAAPDGARRHDGADLRPVGRRQGAQRPPDPRRITARRRAVHRRQLRGPDRDAAGERAVRPREGRVHRRHRRSRGPDRGGERRHAAARRDRGDLRGHAGEAAARAARARDPAGGRVAQPQGARARAGRHQPDTGRRGGAGRVPPRSVLPAACHRASGTIPAGAPLRHRAPDAAIPGGGGRAASPSRRRHHVRGG